MKASHRSAMEAKNRQIDQISSERHQMREAIALQSQQERMKVELREENAALRNEAIGLKSQIEGLNIECQSLVKQLNMY